MLELLKYCEDLQIKEFDTNTTILEDGGNTNKIYFLIEGEVVVEKNEVEINVVSEPGAIFGEMSILLNLPHMATVKTTVPSKFYVSENGLDFLKTNMNISYFISKMLATRLHGVTSYLVDFKKQYEDHPTHHFRMVDSVLENIVNQQDDESSLGSDRIEEPTT